METLAGIMLIVSILTNLVLYIMLSGTRTELKHEIRERRFWYISARSYQQYWFKTLDRYDELARKEK